MFFITQSYFVVPKDIRLNSTHYFVMKIANKQELQQIANNHSSDVNSQDFMNLYTTFYDTTFATDNSLSFRKNFIEKI